MIYPFVAVASVVVGAVGGWYDISMTEKGLKKGLAVEGNTWLVGEKPTVNALLLRDGLLFSACVIPTLVSFFLGNIPIAFGLAVAPAVFGIKHYLGGRAWKKLGA